MASLSAEGARARPTIDGQCPLPPSPPDITVTAQFPPKLQCLFRPKRHKVLWGGRGAGRSWGVARALLLIGAQRAIRVLCARELQNSIAESVHKLLSDQIAALGLVSFYNIQAARIDGSNGTSFAFEGIKNNVSKIRSYEGVDYCWVEEANKVSAASWEVLLPTIRKEDPANWRELGLARPNFESEIWITFNPELATDYTYKRFVMNPSDNSVVVKMTWKDNPWFPGVLEKERDDLRERDLDAYLNVWEGNCRESLEGAIFAKELRRVTGEGRASGRVAWDRQTPVDTFWDLGRRDMTCVWFVQRVAMQYRVLEYFEGSNEEIHYYLRHLASLDYTYGTCYLPHDAEAKRLGEKRTIEQIVRAFGYKTRIVARPHRKANAINAARIVFPNCWFDAKHCEVGLNRLRHYTYQIKDGQRSEEPLHDENSHGADAFMTFAQAIHEPVDSGMATRLVARLTSRINKHLDESPNLGWLNG